MSWRLKIDPRPFMRKLLGGFGTKFVLYLTLVYGFIKGLVYQALVFVMLPFFKNTMRVNAVDYQKYFNVAMMAFAIKPLLGTVSDSIPIFGYHKRFYLVIFFIAGAVSILASTLLPEDPSSGSAAAGFFFICVLAVAGADLMCEGKYSEVMVQKKETGSSVVTWVWLCFMSGSVVAALIEGPLADNADPKIVLYILIPLLLIPVVPTFLGWLPEKSAAEIHHETHGEGDIYIVGAQPAKKRGLVSSAVLKHKGITTLSIVTSFVALGMVVISLLVPQQWALLIYIGITVTALHAASFVVLPRAAAKANLFMFCKELFYLQINGVLDYFYTAEPDCLPDGPHFSFTYYQTFANIAASGGGILGVMLFQRFLSTRKFRLVFWFTTVLKVFAAFFDLMMVKRWNEAIGIPDKATYICGDAIIGQVAMMLDFMPAAVLMSKLCPKGMEATMYALLAGFTNFGQACSRAIGYIMAEAYDIQEVKPCNFDHLWELVVVGHMILPLAVIPLSIALIPNTTMKQDVLSREDVGESETEDTTSDETDPDGTSKFVPASTDTNTFTSDTPLESSLLNEEAQTM